MTSLSPPAYQNALVLLDLPASALVGLDLLSLTTPSSSSIPALCLTDLPAGFHFLYAGSSAALAARTGFWFQIPSSRTGSGSGSGPGSGSGRTPPFVVVWRWDRHAEELVPCARSATETVEWTARLADAVAARRALGSGALMPFAACAERADPARTRDWKGLTAHVAAPRVSRFTCGSEAEREGGATDGSLSNPSSAGSGGGGGGGGGGAAAAAGREDNRSTESAVTTSVWAVSTASCGPRDRETIPGLDEESQRRWGRGRVEGEERELGLLDIDLKRTWRDGAVGAERTRGARDRSWALEQVANSSSVPDGGPDGRNDDDDDKKTSWGSGILGEMQLCFVMILVLTNWSCLQQWRRILELVMTSRDAVLEHPDFFVAFLKTLELQMRHFDDVEGGLFDLNDDGAAFLKTLLRGFRRILEEDAPDDTRAPTSTREEGSGRANGHTDTESGDRDSAGALRQTTTLRNEDGANTIVVSRGRKKVKARFQSIEDWVRDSWDWELGSESYVRKGMVDLEDGERVELEMDELEAEDERGEYAPMVVDL